MTPQQQACLSYTVEHFQEVARQNRFPENSSIPHDTERCVVCHPELLPQHPFITYLDVVTQSVKVRRPRLDAELVTAINDDLALIGSDRRISHDSLLAEEEQAMACLRDWLHDALATGLELLAIHSPGSREFTLEEMESGEMAPLIPEKIQEIIAWQRDQSHPPNRC
jgi:hypothetical protein